MPSQLSILCPVFNEEEVTLLFFARMQSVAERLSQRYDVRLVFLNNASQDRTLEIIRSLQTEHQWVNVISLSTNMGYQRSVECGLRTVQSDLYVIIDVDGEDPPEMIETFVEAFEQGFDIVYGERVDREEPRLLKAARRLFYRLMRAVADDAILLDMAEFSLITREVRNAVVADASSFPFIRASIGRVGFRRRAIPYRRHARMAGKTHYNVFRMVTFAAAGILSASTWLLRMTIYTLPVWIATAVALCVAAILGNDWAIPLLILVIGGYISAALSIVAIYVARIYKNTLGRPNFHIDSKATFLDADLAAGSNSGVAGERL